MKVQTVNVIEYEGKVIRQLVAFSMDDEGKKQAEELFEIILKEHGVKGIEIELALEDRVWDSMDGYQVFITNSI